MISFPANTDYRLARRVAYQIDTFERTEIVHYFEEKLPDEALTSIKKVIKSNNTSLVLLIKNQY